MARGAAQTRRKRPTETQPKKRRQAAPSWEEQLFFSRLRRHAKVMYVLLALVFAVGFVAFGVGSGSTGISGALQSLFNGGSGGSSVSSRIKSDQKKLAKNPDNATLYTDLATLYQQKNENAAAIRTLESGAKAKPRNLEILGALATAYRRQAETAKNDAQNAQAALNATFFTQPGLNTSSTFGSAFTSDPVSQALKTEASSTFAKLSSTYSKAESAYKRVATASRGTSGEATAQLQLASIALEALNYTGQPTEIQTAIDAYKRYLAIDPKGPNAAQAKQALKQLQTFLPKSHR
ncbi:MAG: tetratricopeptide repeat protein [Gaiellaceae bacterium]